MRGYALHSLGHLHREQGHWETARACYDEARLLGEELQEPFVLFEPRLGLALLAWALTRRLWQGWRRAGFEQRLFMAGGLAA